jgi:cellulose 1,4-beta-cellobiosidase
MRFNPLRGPSRTGLRRTVTAAAALVLGTVMAVVVVTNANAATGCSVTYQNPNAWTSGTGAGGFNATLAITNLGDPITSWTLTFTMPAGQTRNGGWNANYTGTTTVSATDMGWNGAIGTGQTNTSVGIQGTWTNAAGIPSPFPQPANFTLNGVNCTGTVTGGPTTGGNTGTPTATATATRTASPTASATRTASPSPSTSTSSCPPATCVHAPNPFADNARGYVNPEWRARANSETGGNRVSNQPTGVWLDSISAIGGGPNRMGLQAHLDAALAQANAGTTPLYAQFVIYDLPGRDCAALASNGELGPTEIGRYQTDYINPIAQLMGDPKYRNLRIVTIIEIDSLPNLVTNASGQAGATSQCATMLQNGNYVNGVRYALDKLHAIPNVYTYIDAAHHGWVGWGTNFNPFADLLASTAEGTAAHKASVDGFIVNTANYSALQEQFFNINTTVNGQTVKNAHWVDFNDFVDELSFAQAFRNKLVSVGFDPGIGMLIDTSRNGWGGSARPTAASTSTDVNTFVNESRIDRRIHAGNWCNQSGAGLGERPRANPASGIDAYVWIKPPGESDGSSSLIPTGPNNPDGKGFDQMCDPLYTGNARNGNSMSGALPNAPVSGAWFSAQFQELMRNAFPPL